MEHHRLKNVKSNRISVDIIEPLCESVEIDGGAPNVHALASKSAPIEIVGNPEAGQVLCSTSNSLASWCNFVPVLDEVDFPIYPEIVEEQVCDDPYVINVNTEGLTNPMMCMAPVWKKVKFNDASPEIELDEESETYLKSVGPLCYLNLNVQSINVVEDTKDFYLSMAEFPRVSQRQSGIALMEIDDSEEPLLCEVCLEENGLLYVSPQTALSANTEVSLRANLVFCKK